MAMRLCDQDRRNITNKNIVLGSEQSSEGVTGDKLRKSLALYLRNWKKGYCKGRRERIISMLEPNIMDDMFLGHAAFCRECAAVIEKYEEQGLKKNTDIKDQWRAYIDNMMDRRLGLTYKRKFDIHESGLEILLDPDADECRLLEILEQYMEGHRDRLFRYKDHASGGEEHKTKLRVLFLTKRKEILSGLNEDMKQNGWNWKLKEERVERLLYRFEHEAAKLFKQNLGILELFRISDKKEFEEKARVILDNYLSVKKDESYESHRMQLIIHMKEELKAELLHELRVYRKENGQSYSGNENDAVKWLDTRFECAYKIVYERHQEQFRRLLQGGEDNQDAVQEIFRGFLRRFRWIDIYEKGLNRELAFGYADNPIMVDAWEVFSNLFMTISASVKKFENTKKVEGDMVRYGFDPAQESEWVERMLLICYWDVDRQMKNFEIALLKEDDSHKKISWNQLDLNEDDEEHDRVINLSSGERAAVITDYSMVEEAEYLKRQYSVLVHAKTLIQRALNMNRKPSRVMPFVFYTWIMPFEYRNNADDILNGYIKYKEGKKEENEENAKGYARTSYNQILWDAYHGAELLNMRMDMADKLNTMLNLSDFSGRLCRNDYQVLDQKLKLWEFTDEERYVIVPMKKKDEAEPGVKYVIAEKLADKKARLVKEEPDVEYRKRFDSVVSSPSAISQNNYQIKYSTKQEKQTKEERPNFDWEQILKDVKKVMEAGQAEVFYGR